MAHHLAFMEWAGSYEGAKAPARSRDLHEQWMLQLSCPVLRLESTGTVEEMKQAVIAALSENASE